MSHLSRLKERLWPQKSGIANTFDLYIPSLPCLQNSIDAIAGWSTAFPTQYGLKAGRVTTYNDPRIRWAIECYGSLASRRVLELGSFEAGHARMLEAAGARVDTIEADHGAFLRCLIAREIYGLTRSTFWLGDFMKSLENSEQRYDLIIACDILHQIKEPLHFVELAVKRADALYVWTHLATKDATLLQPHAFTNALERRTVSQDADEEYRRFDSNGLVEALKTGSFTDIRIAPEALNHPRGPAISIFARK
jgi:hypothetical protein